MRSAHAFAQGLFAAEEGDGLSAEPKEGGGGGGGGAAFLNPIHIVGSFKCPSLTDSESQRTPKLLLCLCVSVSVCVSLCEHPSCFCVCL